MYEKCVRIGQTKESGGVRGSDENEPSLNQVLQVNCWIRGLTRVSVNFAGSSTVGLLNQWVYLAPRARADPISHATAMLEEDPDCGMR